MKKKFKPESPAIIHARDGEKSGNFHQMFKDQTRKISDSQGRVQMVSSPYLATKQYFDNYDDIRWDCGGKQLKKML